MGKHFDALYGEMTLDPLTLDAEPTIKEGEDPGRIGAILMSRAEGYYERAVQFEKNNQEANAQAAHAVCRELVYLAKEIIEGRIEQLENRGEDNDEAPGD